MRLLRLVVAVLAATTVAQAELVYEGPLEDGPGYTAYLVSYRSDGLKVHAMVAVPRGDAPEQGFPVVVANHGYVPDPRNYGITSGGVNSRPGDYYRSVPGLYTSRGFLVVMPDYRGHNDSEGYEQIGEQGPAAIKLYARDVLALMRLLGNIEHADLDRVFLWSHSMGGNVSMIALLETDLVKASSFWATGALDEHFTQLEQLTGPVIMQHSNGDQSTDPGNSERLSAALAGLGHPQVFYSYDGDDHFFGAARRELAADRDAQFFLASTIR